MMSDFDTHFMDAERQPPPTVDEIKSALDNLHSDESCRRLLFRLFRALQSDYALVSREDREQAITAAVTSGTNQMSAAFYAKTPASADLATAATDCEQTARQLLHLPGPSDE